MTLVCERGAGSGKLVSYERGACERRASKTFFFNFFPKKFSHNFFRKIEENLLFIVSFWTYDHVPYNRGLCEIFIFVSKIVI